MPPDCETSVDSPSCDSIVTWKARNDDIVIEIEGKISNIGLPNQHLGKYVALGFSYDDKMVIVDLKTSLAVL